MAEYIDRGAIKYEQWAVGAGSSLLMVVRKKTIDAIPAADVVERKRGECPVCRGEKAILQDCNNGVSIEVDSEQLEMSVWQGDECIAVFSIDFCPNCGADMRSVEA